MRVPAVIMRPFRMGWICRGRKVVVVAGVLVVGESGGANGDSGDKGCWGLQYESSLMDGVVVVAVV